MTQPLVWRDFFHFYNYLLKNECYGQGAIRDGHVIGWIYQ
jgi:hypothetical protein